MRVSHPSLAAISEVLIRAVSILPSGIFRTSLLFATKCSRHGGRTRILPIAQHHQLAPNYAG